MLWRPTLESVGRLYLQRCGGYDNSLQRRKVIFLSHGGRCEEECHRGNNMQVGNLDLTRLATEGLEVESWKTTEVGSNPHASDHRYG